MDARYKWTNHFSLCLYNTVQLVRDGSGLSMIYHTSCTVLYIVEDFTLTQGQTLMMAHAEFYLSTQQQTACVATADMVKCLFSFMWVRLLNVRSGVGETVQ